MSDEQVEGTDEATTDEVDESVADGTSETDESAEGTAAADAPVTSSSPLPAEHPSKGNRIAIGDFDPETGEGRFFLYDTDENGAVINFRGENESPEEARLAKRPKSHSN